MNKKFDKIYIPRWYHRFRVPNGASATSFTLSVSNSVFSTDILRFPNWIASCIGIIQVGNFEESMKKVRLKVLVASDDNAQLVNNSYTLNEASKLFTKKNNIYTHFFL